MTTYQTVHQTLKSQAEQNPDAVAILAPGRKPLTYRSLYLHVERIVKGLNALGITRNDRVAIVLPNGPEMATAFLGVASGATSAPLNPAYRAGEFDFYLSDLNAKALLTPCIPSPRNVPAWSLAITGTCALIAVRCAPLPLICMMPASCCGPWSCPVCPPTFCARHSEHFRVA